VELNSEQLAAVALPEDLREAVEQARRITRHEARRRQLQYIGRLMRSVDPEAIRESSRRGTGLGRETARLHRIERWRERLIEDDGALGALARRPSGHRHPAPAGAGAQHARGAQRGQAAARLPRAVQGAAGYHRGTANGA